MTITVYRSSDASAPQLSGSLVNTTDVAAILEACLVTGYGSKAGQGWTKPYASGNVTVFRQPVGTSNGFYLQLDTTYANYAAPNLVGYDVAFRGYETMSSATAGTGPFPTTTQVAGGVYQMRVYTNGTANVWDLYTNGKIIYFCVRAAAGSTAASIFAFGDVTPVRTGDAYATVICGNFYVRQPSYHAATSSCFPRNVSVGSTDTMNYMARSYTQLGSSVAIGKHSDYNKCANATVWGAGGMTYPNPADNQLWFGPAFVHEANALRGVLPGIWVPYHNLPLTTGDVFTATGTFADRQFEAVTLYGNTTGNSYSIGQVFIELTDNW